MSTISQDHARATIAEAHRQADRARWSRRLDDEQLAARQLSRRRVRIQLNLLVPTIITRRQ